MVGDEGRAWTVKMTFTFKQAELLIGMGVIVSALRKASTVDALSLSWQAEFISYPKEFQSVKSKKGHKVYRKSIYNNILLNNCVPLE